MSSRSCKFHSQLGRAGFLAVVVSAILIFTGCDSGGDPGASPSASASAIPTASASATPTPSPTIAAVYKPADASGPAQNVLVPVLPDVAKTETKEGLEAFTRYWYATLSYAYETGDLNRLSSITSATCATCESAKGVIDNWYSDGRWLQGGKIVTPAIESNFLLTPEGSRQVVVQVQQSELVAFKSDRTMADRSIPATDTAQIFIATYKDVGWYVLDVQQLNG